MRIPFVLIPLLGLVLLASSACRPAYPNCKDDAHCSERGEVCVEQICKECGSDADCKAGFVCNENACVQAPECRLDADCADGMRCRGDRCVPQCTDNRDCAKGEHCEQNRCVANVECSLDEDCPAGQACRDGRCADGIRSEALSDEEARRRAALASCTLDRVSFEFDHFALSESARAVLERNAECIRFKSAPVVIEGHCDERGTDEYNLILGEKRANAVKRYLIGLGVPAGLLRTVSYGEERPLDPSPTEAGWSRNRRVDFR